MNGTLMICGGGTAGHIFPGLAIAAELVNRGRRVEWLGVAGGMEERLVAQAGIKLHTVEFAKPTGGLSGLAAAAYKARDAAKKARSILTGANTRAVLGLGAYPSLPGVLAALSLKIPRLIHEQNVKYGLATRALMPIANRILTSFAGKSSAKTFHVGLPVRAEFAAVAPPEQRFAERMGNLRAVVMGGSRGATSINAGIPAALAVSDSEFEHIVHQAGHGNAQATIKSYEAAGLDAIADVREFIDDVPGELAKADMVICRAGASTIAELCSVGLGALLIPYPHAQGHQDANADVMADADAAVKAADSLVLDPEAMRPYIGMLGHRLKLTQRAQAARALAKPDAAAAVANHCEEVINET